MRKKKNRPAIAARQLFYVLLVVRLAICSRALPYARNMYTKKPHSCSCSARRTTNEESKNIRMDL